LPWHRWARDTIGETHPQIGLELDYVETALLTTSTNVLLNILGGSQRVDGAELRAEGQLTSKLSRDNQVERPHASTKAY
jgi:hypothetical protein